MIIKWSDRYSKKIEFLNFGNKRMLIEATHPDLSMRHQCELLGINRSITGRLGRFIFMNRTEIFPNSGQTGTHGGNFLRLNARGAAIPAPAGIGHASDFELSTYPQNSQRKRKTTAISSP